MTLWSIEDAVGLGIIFFFLSWILVGKFVILTLFLAVTMEAFESKYDSDVTAGAMRIKNKLENLKKRKFGFGRKKGAEDKGGEGAGKEGSGRKISPQASESGSLSGKLNRAVDPAQRPKSRFAVEAQAAPNAQDAPASVPMVEPSPQVRIAFNQVAPEPMLQENSRRGGLKVFQSAEAGASDSKGRVGIRFADPEDGTGSQAGSTARPKPAIKFADESGTNSASDSRVASRDNSQSAGTAGKPAKKSARFIGVGDDEDEDDVVVPVDQRRTPPPRKAARFADSVSVDSSAEEEEPASSQPGRPRGVRFGAPQGEAADEQHRILPLSLLLPRRTTRVTPLPPADSDSRPSAYMASAAPGSEGPVAEAIDDDDRASVASGSVAGSTYSLGTSSMMSGLSGGTGTTMTSGIMDEMMLAAEAQVRERVLFCSQDARPA